MSIVRKISIIGVCLFTIILSLYIGVRIHYGELRTLSERWNLHIPTSTKLEEYHSTDDRGFTGDGYRILVVTCNEKDINNTVFEYAKFNTKLSLWSRSLIQECYEAFPDKKASKISDFNNLKSVLYSKYDDFLLIVYDEITTKYFIFEDLS